MHENRSDIDRALLPNNHPLQVMESHSVVYEEQEKEGHTETH